MMDFREFVAARAGTRDWIVCSRLTENLKGRGYSVAIHPMRFRKWKKDFEAIPEGIDAPAECFLEEWHFQFLEKVKRLGWVALDTNGTGFLPNGECADGARIRALADAGLIEPVDDGLLDGMSQTYRPAEAK